MLESTIIHSAHLAEGPALRPDVWLSFRDRRVDAMGIGDSWRERDADVVIDARDDILSPGFIDIHCHGAAGVGYDQAALDPQSIDTALDAHLAHGTTTSMLSLVSAPIAHLCERLRGLQSVVAERPGLLGVHLEGPFLDPGHRGAHDPSALIDPSPADVEALIASGDGIISQVTLAPERAGAIDAITRFVGAGIVVAVGHTGADADTARRAFEAGASILTHTCNAMEPIHHRAPGPIVAAMTAGVTMEVIADGVHVDPDVVSMLFRAAPGRIALVTDAMAAACAGDGRYELGGLEVTVTDGVARLAGGGSIAGSTLTQDRALQVATRAGVAVACAIEALTATPARAIGRPDLGTLDIGARADAVLLAADGTVRQVWRAGQPVGP